MAWSINSVAQATPSTSSPLGLTYAGVAGRLYVLCLSRNSAADAFTTVTDSAGNTWTRLDYAPKSGTVGRRVDMWACVPSSNFATISVAFSGSTLAYGTLVEITGGNGVVNQVNALERSNSSNPPAVTITPDEANTLVLAFCQANPNTISEMDPGAGWTSLASNTGGPDVVYRTDAASGVAVGVSWTFNTGAGSGHAIAAFEEASPSISPTAVVELGATETIQGEHSISPSAGLELGATAVVSKEIGFSPTVGIELSATAVVEPVQIEDLEVTILAGRDDDWRPDTDQTLIAKYATTGDQRAWMLGLDADGGGDMALAGRPMFAWSTDGTAAEVVEVYATERAPVDPYGQVHLRVFLDVNNGMGGWTVVFEYRDPDGTWTALGDPVTGSGATLINPSSTADLTIGAHDDGTAGMFLGRVYSAQVRVGRTGEVQALVDFTNHPAAGTTSFSDDTGNAWSVEAPATLTSTQTLTTVAVLGPLDTDECAEWTDFTLPRSGVGRTCDHHPDGCCSYYRVRTVGRVDGSLLVSDWSSTVDPDTFCLEWDEDEHLIRTTGPTGPLWAPVLGKFDWAVERPFTAATGVMGSRFVTSAAPGGRNLSMTAAVESEEELARLRAVLARPLVLISPSDAEEVWAAPVAESVRIVKVGRIRQVTASFIGTGPEPPPQLADVGV